MLAGLQNIAMKSGVLKSPVFDFETMNYHLDVFVIATAEFPSPRNPNRIWHSATTRSVGITGFIIRF